MTVVDDAANGRAPKPRALIVTVYGLYAREVGGWLSVAALVRLMGELGVDEPAVRSSISRLKRRGILMAERVGGLAGYRLSDTARAILDDGDRRIFDRGRASPGEGWLLAVFSVPESEREKRHQLRSRLAWLGFGTVSAGVWIAPAHLLDETRDVLERDGLAGYVDLFCSQHVGSGSAAAKVSQWWDLKRLQQRYEQFLDRYAAPLRRYRRRSVGEREAFAVYVAALTEWRRLPYLDPGLAPEVLPPRWNGVRAAETFFELQERLAAPAHQFVESVRTAGG